MDHGQHEYKTVYYYYVEAKAYQLIEFMNADAKWDDQAPSPIAPARLDEFIFIAKGNKRVADHKEIAAQLRTDIYERAKMIQKRING